MGNLVFKAMTVAAAVLASTVARKTTDGTWKFVTGGDSPTNPEDPDIDLKEAIAFAVLSGAVVGITRLLINRQATRTFAKATKRNPKDVAEQGAKAPKQA